MSKGVNTYYYPQTLPVTLFRAINEVNINLKYNLQKAVKNYIAANRLAYKIKVYSISEIRHKSRNYNK